MVTPKIWGQGQLFAFSALDGDSHWDGDLTGTLCGDKMGIRFHTKVKRELVLTNLQGLAPKFSCVSSDLILIDTCRGQASMIFANRHTVIGSLPETMGAVVLCEGEHTLTKEGDLQIQNTGDGESTALLRSGNRFAFAFGNTAEEAAQNAYLGIDLDMDALVGKKLAFYQKHGLPENHPYAPLASKVLSVMRSQLYSPEGRFRRIWSTPDRLPHKHLWLWDSVFHGVGFRNIDPTLAEDLILDIFDAQSPDGFIPHMATPVDTSSITQPPVIGWGAWMVYQKSNNRAFLQTVLEQNKKFLLWCRENRRDTDEELYTWLTKADVRCRCDESGMDNSPRFDRITRLQAIDFSCFMANDVRHMAMISRELQDTENETFFSGWFEKIKADINRKLWCEEDGFYYDYDLESNRQHKIQSVASFLPLFSGVCSRSQAASLRKWLTDPEAFYTPLPVPCISKKDTTYGSDMWRGPVWMNYNYMIIQGLQNYGEISLSREFRDKTLAAINEWYHKNGTVYEFYDPENQKSPKQLNRKGPVHEPYDFTVRYQSIRDYGWTATLTLDLLYN